MTPHDRDPAHGWEPAFRLQHECAKCVHAVREARMAACDHAQRQFPGAQNCPRFLPDDMDD